MIEVLVGIFVASCLAMLGALLIPVAKQGQIVGSEYSRVTELAQTKLDKIRELGFGRMNSDDMIDAEICGTKSNSLTCAFVLDAADGGPAGATGQAVISDFNSDLKRAKVTIYWNSKGSTGKAHNFSLETLVARP